MDYNDKLSYINNRKNMYRFLVILNFWVVICLSLIGTVSIVNLIMYLYEVVDISILECFLLDVTLPYFYSCCMNAFIKKIDVKIKDVGTLIDDLEKEYEIEQIINDIRIRFNSLSRDRQKELLNYIKNNCLYMVSGFEKIDELSDNEILMLINNMDSIKLVQDRENILKRTRG